MFWALAILAMAAAGYVIAAVTSEMNRSNISLGNALRLLPYKSFNFLDTSEFEAAKDRGLPVIYAISEQSLMDRKIYTKLLPDDTVHIFDLADIDTRLKASQRCAIYIPENVEPDENAFAVFSTIAAHADAIGAKIVPLHMKGARFLSSSHTPEDKAPRQRLPRLSVHALKGQTISQMVQHAGQDRTPPSHALFDRMALTRFQTTDFNRGLFNAMVDAAVTYGPDRIIVEDTVTGTLTYKRLLIGARVLGKKFAAISKPEEAMGVLLPNANGAIVTFFGLQSAGRISAMLNYTAGPANIVSAISTAGIKTIITSRAFIEKADLQPVIDAVTKNGTQIMWLEDVRKDVSTFDKVSAFLQWKRPLQKIDAERAAVILFTSGSEGTPKGVVLSHRNIHANAAQSEARVSISVKDTLFNVLPIFHSFGLTGGTILPLFYGVRLFLYPSPLHYKQIPATAREVRPTIMFGTDTFLMGYARTAKDKDFETLRFVVAGAEAVKPETARIYMERFNCWILEGFGMTEAAPVVAVNTRTHTKPNSVGRLLPGIDVRLEPVEGIEEGGRMWVRGPNVMLGYMTADRPGVLQPMGDGWHDSGDIVSIDDCGFVSIRGRAKRFAKIAGEMVSLGAVEMLVQSLWPEDQHAAVSVPDRRKGERIVLATTAGSPEKSALVEHGKKNGVTELMVPSDILQFDDIPVLGSGKIDYVSTKKRVNEALGIDDKAA